MMNARPDYDELTEAVRELEHEAESPGARDLYNEIIQGDGLMSDSGGDLGPARTSDVHQRALADFGRWCLDAMRYPAPGDIDGGEAQEEAIRLGLLAYTQIDEPCGEYCACAEYHGSDDFPVQCLRENAAWPQRPEATSGESQEVPNP